MIQLQEYEQVSVELTDSDAVFIEECLRGKFSIVRPVNGIGYLVNPNQYVGVLNLPSGERLAVQPKVAISSVFQMIAEADAEVLRLYPLVGLNSWPELLEFVADYFAELLAERVRRGLFRAYTVQEENLSAVRGRILFREDLRLNLLQRQRTYCEYSEFTWDVAENQVLRQVLQQLSRWPFKRTLQVRLGALDRLLDEVTPGAFTASEVNQFAYHRMNDDYRPLHSLCALFLDGASLSEHEGAVPFPGFLVDMNRLFERFVSALLSRLAPSSVRVSYRHTSTPLDVGNKVHITPDILITGPTGELTVLDCKYKRAMGEDFSNADVYQMIAYCTALNSRRAILLHPRSEAALVGELSIRHSAISVHHKEMDLSGEGPAFMSNCESFARTVINWVAS